MKFEFADYDSTLQSFNHYSTRTPSQVSVDIWEHQSNTKLSLKRHAEYK